MQAGLSVWRGGSRAFLSRARLEEEEKLVSAEVLYRRASALDQTFQEAAEALEKLQLRIQVSE